MCRHDVEVSRSAELCLCCEAVERLSDPGKAVGRSKIGVYPFKNARMEKKMALHRTKTHEISVFWAWEVGGFGWLDPPTSRWLDPPVTNPPPT